MPFDINVHQRKKSKWTEVMHEIILVISVDG